MHDPASAFTLLGDRASFCLVQWVLEDLRCDFSDDVAT